MTDLAVGALVAIAAYLALCVVSEARPTRLRLVNDSDHRIDQLFVSPVGTVDWCGCVLHGATIAPHTTRALHFDDDEARNCRFDFTFVLDNGEKVERRSIDACEGEFVFRT